MLIGIAAVVVCTLQHHGGFSESLRQMGEIEQGQFATLFGPEPLNLLGVVILTSLGTWALCSIAGTMASYSGLPFASVAMAVFPFSPFKVQNNRSNPPMK